MSFEATATISFDEATWTVVEQADGTWLATHNGFTYYLPYTPPTEDVSVMGVTSLVDGSISSVDSPMETAVQTTMEHARAVAIVFSIIGGIGLITLVAALVYRIVKRKRVKELVGVRVERSVSSDYDPNPLPSRKTLGTSFLHWSGLQRRSTMVLPIHRPPRSLVLDPNGTSQRNSIISMEEFPGIPNVKKLEQDRAQRTRYRQGSIASSTPSTPAQRLVAPAQRVSLTSMPVIDIRPPTPPPIYTPSLSYDPHDKMTSIVSANIVTRYTHDSVYDGSSHWRR